jgi:hypothetical protein
MEKNVKKSVGVGEPSIQKSVNDLGIAAYLMMHGYKVTGRRNRTVFFKIIEVDSQEFDSLGFEYLSSPYHQFDSCLMSLKKIGEYDPKFVNPDKLKSVNDLGIAAYLMMHAHKVVGRRNRTVYFEIPEAEFQEFDSLGFEYLSSPYHQFDSCLMSLKKIGEYDPN